jgi:beta-galactosidase
MTKKISRDQHDVGPDGRPISTAAPSRRQALIHGVAAAVLTPNLAAATTITRTGHIPRRELSFDEGWRFYRGDIGGAEASSFDDANWRELDLPHDWRIEDLPYATSDDGGATADPSGFAYLKKPFANEPPEIIGPFDVTADPKPDLDIVYPPLGHIVFPGGRGQAYTVAGLGWYRKSFKLPVEVKEHQRFELRFDGVYQNADVWLNGAHLGFHPNGYCSFAYDLTPYLNRDGSNVLAVRVDNRGKTSRWYSGSGIYRHTWLTATGLVRIPLWGVRVTTPVVDPRSSTVRAEVKVANVGESNRLSVRMTVLDPNGRTVAVETAPARSLAKGETAVFASETAIGSAALWSPDTPELYQMRAEILAGQRVVDAVTTPFGIRSLRFDGSGFRLNGKTLKIRGANIHHDNGPLGAVAIDRAEERKIEILKAAGFNAIRGSHNPRSPCLLDACDRLGMLIYDEFTDMWDTAKMADDYHRYFPDWWERDLTSLVQRDFNHPSVILWSIGNEISDPNDYGPRLANYVRTLDKSRPVTQGGINVGLELGPKHRDPLQYIDIGDYHGVPPASAFAAHPNMAFLQSEDVCSQIYDNWKLGETNPAYVGGWVWSGWDYIGEAGAGATAIAHSKGEAVQAAMDSLLGKVLYPWFNNFQSDIDLIGQRKPQNRLRAVVNGFSSLELLVERPTPPGVQQFDALYSYYDELQSWTWDVPHDQPMVVRVYTVGDSVTLVLNGQPLETKSVDESNKRMVTFDVPYRPGDLTAVASRGGVELARKTLTTAGQPAAIRLTSDVASLTTSRKDLAHVLVEITDAQGCVVPDAVVKVSFEIEGAGELGGVGNANPHNVDSFKRPRRWTWHGQALAILRPAKQPGALLLRATAAGLNSAELNLQVGVPQPTHGG